LLKLRGTFDLDRIPFETRPRARITTAAVG
jgi:hypothetical protein